MKKPDKEIQEWNYMIARYVSQTYAEMRGKGDPNAMKYIAPDFPLLDERITACPLLFHKDWNWLMDTMKFISKTFETEILSNSCAIGTYMAAGEIDWHVEVEGDDLKEVVYEAIVQFVEWHNENPT